MRRVILGAAALFLSGCATFVETRISTFQQFDQPVVGQKFVIVPVKEQEGNLEFQTYGQLVKAELQGKGMVEAPFGQATFAVFLFYGIDDGREIVSSYPIFGQTGSTGSYTSGTITSYGNKATYRGTTYNRPTYGVVGSGVASRTEFRRYLNIDIADIAKSRPDNIHMVYQGKATSSGSNSELAAVMPAMVRSVFEEFPGTSGASRVSRQTTER